MKLTRFYLSACFLFVMPLSAGMDDAEDFRMEVTAGVWVRNSTGTVKSEFTPVDFQADLGILQNRPQFTGTLVLKPARRHRFVVEGAPYRLSGDSVISRQINIGGQTFTAQGRVVSEGDIAYVFGGYQYDVVSNPRGHFGFGGGVAYVDATLSATSPTFGVTGTLNESFPFPVAATEFRIFLIPGSALLNINGGVKGMSLGDYGHFVQGAIHGGMGLGRHVTLQAGYQVTDADVHRKDQTRGIAPRFTGPVFSVQFRI